MARFTSRGIAAGLAALVVAAVCMRLGFWQLDRLEQRRARNTAMTRALALPPVELGGALLDSVARDPERFRFRRVRAVGDPDDARTLVLRGRAMGGRPGVHLVVPLRLGAGGVAVLVDRGWVPSPDAATVNPAPYAVHGAMTAEGVLQPIGSTGGAGALIASPSGGPVSYARLDLPTLRAALPYRVLPAYLQLLPASSAAAGGAPAPEPLPEPGEGPHLGYAVQWFSFAAIALVGYLVLALRRRGRP